MSDETSRTDDMVDRLNAYSEEFDDHCQQRHEMGEKKYGAGTWLNVDTIEMALEEIIDLANYVRFTYVKLRLLQDNLPAILADKSTAQPKSGNEMLGKDALMKGMP